MKSISGWQFMRCGSSCCERQAEALGLPVQVIDLPSPCTNAQYEAAMGKFVDESKRRGIECMAFGDLFLETSKNIEKRNWPAPESLRSFRSGCPRLIVWQRK